MGKFVDFQSYSLSISYRISSAVHGGGGGGGWIFSGIAHFYFAISSTFLMNEVYSIVVRLSKTILNLVELMVLAFFQEIFSRGGIYCYANYFVVLIVLLFSQGANCLGAPCRPCGRKGTLWYSSLQKQMKFL